MSLPAYATADAHLAKTLAAGLCAAADRLDGATDLGAFIEAVEHHRKVWQGIRRAAPKLGHLVPPQLMEFSLTAGTRARHRLDDHEVETLIQVDRFVAAAMVRA
jgi:hypothetical protein